MITQTQLLSSLTKPPRALKVKGNDFVYVVQILFPVCVYISYSSALVSVYLCASVECCVTALLSFFIALNMLEEKQLYYTFQIIDIKYKLKSNFLVFSRKFPHFFSY